ncbi:MAG: LysR family transcriptional regulator [Christensenellales bacterium]
MLISYDAYRVFYTVARLGSFTKAAGTLLSSQPNLTRTIRNLESALGCTLFVRSNRGAVLTPEGEKLFARVAVACEQIQAGEEELASDRSLQSGVVSIGASETALHGFLLPVLGAFHRASSGHSPAHRQPFHAAGVFRPAQRLWWMSPSSPPPRRTQAAYTSSRSANSRRCPSAARR